MGSVERSRKVETRRASFGSVHGCMVNAQIGQSRAEQTGVEMKEEIVNKRLE